MDQETGLIVDAAVEQGKPSEVATRSSGEATQEELLGHSKDDSNEEEVYLDCSTHTLVPNTSSGDDKVFNPVLPTRMGGQDQTLLAKEEVAKNGNIEIDDGKSAIVQVNSTMESTDNLMASKPQEDKEIKVIEKQEASGGLEDCPQDDKFLQYHHQINMITKKDFKNANHFKSGRYYLPEKHSLSATGRKYGLLVSLQTMANFYYPCGTMFQAYYSKVPILRLRSPGINDLSSLKIEYWDNSCLYMKEGLPVEVKIPTEILVEWLTSPSKVEKTTVQKAMSKD